MISVAPRVERALLILLVGCTAAALLGYASFGLHPALMGTSLGAMRAYAAAITGFPRAHIVLGAAAIATALTRGSGGQWLPAAVTLYAVSLASELLGTSYGMPFGPYHYTDALGIKWLGLVPVLIPLSWFTMSASAFAITRRLVGVRGHLTTIAAGSLLLVAWDLALDPAMSRLTPYWVWGEAGPYFGMPILNLIGWFLTGAALMMLLVVLRAGRWVDSLSPSAMTAITIVYASNLALPIGMTIAAGLPLAALSCLCMVGLVCSVAWLRRRERRVVRHRSRHAEAAR